MNLFLIAHLRELNGSIVLSPGGLGWDPRVSGAVVTWLDFAHYLARNSSGRVGTRLALGQASPIMVAILWCIAFVSQLKASFAPSWVFC